MLSIRSVQAIVTAPQGINLVVVKIETSEPGLYGLGCATFTQRCLSVATAVEQYLAPLLAGRDPDRIEELWNLGMVHSYWRNGPVLNSAVSGVDMALWDIKAKCANMPLYQLLGGKVREGAAVYRWANGRDPRECEDRAREWIEQGVRHVRIQCGPNVGMPYGGLRLDRPEGALDGDYYDPADYMRRNLAALQHVRDKLGPEIELIHDIHERLRPADAVRFARELEPVRLFFLEDALAPEDIEWFANIRAASAVPLAMGELFVHPGEWMPLVSRRLIDFIRIHISAIGGLTPARKVAHIAEAFGVRTAWHGPFDVSPVGHAVSVHLDIASTNFGIQELFSPGFEGPLREVFPGCPEVRNGYLYASDRPGHGVDLDLTAAAKYPHQPGIDRWTQARLPDGTITRP